MADTAVEIARRMNQQFLDIWTQFDLDGRVAAFASDPQYRCTVLLDNGGNIRFIFRLYGRMFTPQTFINGDPVHWSAFHDNPGWDLLHDISSCSSDGYRWFLFFKNNIVGTLGYVNESPPPLPPRN
jgi:hypothetical protein